MMQTQKFKGDDLELKMEAVGNDAFALCSASLDAFYAEGFFCNPFLLMLFDEGRAPFSDRVPRDSFPLFLREAVQRFPFSGTFETYIFIIEAVFGAGSEILFDVPGPGRIQMAINASANLDFDWVASEFIDGEFVLSEIVDDLDEVLSFSGISGIDSQYELEQLFAELIPAGIFPEITLTFFSISPWIADDGGVDYSVVDHVGNQLIFVETEV